jgi:hypothetical protein
MVASDDSTNRIFEIQTLQHGDRKPFFSRTALFTCAFDPVAPGNPANGTYHRGQDRMWIAERGAQQPAQPPNARSWLPPPGAFGER